MRGLPLDPGSAHERRPVIDGHGGGNSDGTRSRDTSGADTARAVQSGRVRFRKPLGLHRNPADDRRLQHPGQLVAALHVGLHVGRAQRKPGPTPSSQIGIDQAVERLGQTSLGQQQRVQRPAVLRMGRRQRGDVRPPVVPGGPALGLGQIAIGCQPQLMLVVPDSLAVVRKLVSKPLGLSAACWHRPSTKSYNASSE